MDKKAKIILGAKIAGAVLMIALVSAAGVYYFGIKKGTLNRGEIKSRMEKFIADELVQPGTKFELSNIQKTNGLYEITVKISGQEIKSYATLDGKIFFPQGIEVPTETPKTIGESGISQTEKPEVKLFVMSFCPFGTQIEKAILPVAEKLKGKIDFSLKFVDYAMHGKKELDENLRQYCIQKYEPEKLNAYLGCFLKKGEGTATACIKEAGIEQYKIAGCVAKTDQDFKVSLNFKDKNTWSNGQYPPFDVDKAEGEKYEVQGSPTLIINDSKVEDAERNPKALLEVICSAFKEKPAECDATLSDESPAAGFGESKATTDTASGSCEN